MTWPARLQLNYRATPQGTLAHDRHEGPLRVLKALYPEGPRVCHHVLVHPPGGIAGGDRLDVDIEVQRDAHALLTTPGAARFYRSRGESARQQVRARVDGGGRLEWLPLETIAHSGCVAENHVVFELAPGAETIGWDVLALGLPASDEPFAAGRFLQHVEWPGRWLERGRLDASDRRLLQSPLGLGGHTVLATLWCAVADGLATAERDALLDAAREAAAGLAPSLVSGATSPAPGLVVLRVLGHRVEPVFALLKAVRARWREQRWQLAPVPPRVWST